MGAGNPKLLGVWLQISMLVITVLAVPTAVALFYAKEVGASSWVLTELHDEGGRLG